MKGLFIPGITAEMFRNGCLESIETLMAEGEIYDIEYPIPVSERLPEYGADDAQARELCRDNYAKQMEALGYQKDGTPVYDRERQQTATDIIEEVKEAMCNDYCRYPREYNPAKHDDLELWDTDICAGCPLNRL